MLSPEKLDELITECQDMKILMEGLWSRVVESGLSNDVGADFLTHVTHGLTLWRRFLEARRHQALLTRQES